jgi:hypothetical protein
MLEPLLTRHTKGAIDCIADAVSSLACVSGSMLEIEPATDVNKKWTVIWMHENNNQSKRRLLIRLSKLI